MLCPNCATENQEGKKFSTLVTAARRLLTRSSRPSRSHAA
jgi:hypothetical protein